MMLEKIQNAIEALNAIITDNSVCDEPRTQARLLTMKRFLLSMVNKYNQTNN